MECLSGRLPLTPSSDLARDWPESRCHTETERGLCFTSVTTSTSGAAVVTVGCWPPHLAGLAWYGVPQCKNEVSEHTSVPHTSHLTPHTSHLTPYI